MPRQSRLMYALLALAAAPLAAQAAPVYTVAPVGNFGNLTSQPNGLNNAGTVVGYVYTPGNHINAYVSNNGAATSLHQGDPNTGNSKAWGINAGGAVVGEASVGNATQAAVFSNGSVHTLGTLGGTNSYGYGINAGGQVVGVSDTSGGGQHGFVTGANNTLVDIGPVNGGGSSAANAINDLGAVTGYAEIDAAADYRAFIYANGAMQFLGTLGGNYAQGYAINNAGMVAGYSFLAGDTESHAFLYANGLVLDLGDLGGTDSYATGINEAGSVVGVSNLGNPNAGYHAFLYSGGVLKDLNDLIDPALGLTLTYASDINDKGQIAARGCKAGNQCADLLLTLADTGNPDPNPNPVPEPEAISAGVAGLLLARLLRRRRAQA
jgi:probable HAF family extracellular repeat protein